MRLISCYIENFGGLQKFSYEFNKGINIILEENGWGKSTLAAFLKAMFYGLERTTKRSLDENERKKYEPWNGGAYGGNLVFETDGSVYRIERFFGIKEKEDSFALYDEETGLESDAYTERIGETLFGIDRIAFEQSIFMRQGMYAVTMTDSVAAKMSGLMAGGDDMDSYEKACARIDSEMKIYKKIGNKGKIPELTEEIAGINRKLAEGKQIHESLKEWEAKKEQSLQKKADLEKQKETLKKLIREAAQQAGRKEKRKHYDSLLEEKEKLEKTLKGLDVFFQNGVPEEEELEKHHKQLFLYNCSEQGIVSEKQVFRYPSVALLLDKYPITEEELDACEQKWNAVREKEKQLEKEKLSLQALQIREEEKKNYLEGQVRSSKNKQRLFFVMAILLLAVAVILYFAVGTLPCCLAILAAGACLIFAFIYLLQGKKTVGALYAENEELIRSGAVCDELEADTEKMKKAVRMYLQAFCEATDEGIPACISKLRITMMEVKAANQRKFKLQAQKEKERKEKEEIKAELILFLHRFYPDVTTVEEYLFKEIAQKRNEYTNVSRQFETKCDQLNKAEKVEEIREEELLSMEQLQQDEMKLEQELSSAENYLRQIKRTMEQYTQILEECEKLEMEKHDLEELLTEYTEKYKLLEKTLKYLKTAQTEFSSRYLKKMNDGFAKYAKLFREDVFKSSALDVKLSVKSDEGGVKREIGYYSTGLRETMELCTRFSLIDALFEKERPFVILDDPFVNLDEKSLCGAKEVLMQIAQNYQLIYFTCHPSRK